MSAVAALMGYAPEAYQMRFSAPWPPTANHCFVTTRTGRRVLRSDAKAYMDSVAKRTRYEANCTPAESWYVWKRDQPVLFVVEATYYKPDRRKRDTDNVRKVLADGLANGLEVDDSQFLWRDQDLLVDRENPRVELVIYPKGA